jgi:type IV secretion system protein VirD4
MIRAFLVRLTIWALCIAALCGVLVYEAVHHRFAILALFFALVFAVLFYRAVLGRRAQVRRRVRALRWRARLRLRPGPGYASLVELVFRWGRLAALSHGRRARPGLGFWRRAFLSCATAYAIRLGRAQYARRVYARMEDQVLVLAPQRVGKSGLVADRILSHPGPVLATSTRPDLYEITSASRARRGPIDVFNPQGVGGLPSTFGWPILDACRDLVMARRIAGWLAGAVLTGDRSNSGNIEWFEKKGDVALACLLWAAAVSGRTITDVFNWSQLHGHEDALHVLASHPDSSPQMLAVVRRMLADNRTSGSVRDTIELSLSWAIIPQLAAAVTPPLGRGFDLARFIGQDGTLYLIASGDEDSPVTPLFRAFVSYVHYAAGLLGTLAPAGRLDPPLLMALDEVTTICPVDLPTMLSDSAGKGILITAVVHGVSQLKERWGEFGGQTVWDTCGTKIFLGGISDAETLEQASGLCGSIVIGEPGGPPVPVVPPEFIRALPEWRALVIRMNLFPVVVKIRPAWKRLRHRLGRPAPAYLPRPAVVMTPGDDFDSTMPLELELFDADQGPGTDQGPGDFPFAGSLTPSQPTRSGGDD